PRRQARKPQSAARSTMVPQEGLPHKSRHRALPRLPGTPIGRRIRSAYVLDVAKNRTVTRAGSGSDVPRSTPPSLGGGLPRPFCHCDAVYVIAFQIQYFPFVTLARGPSPCIINTVNCLDT